MIDLITNAINSYQTQYKLQLLSAHSDGWGMFNLNDPLRCGIERLDESGIFDGDQAALLHVAERAINGDMFASHTLTIHLLCNELRGMTWGDAYINSRLGPS